MRFKEFIESKGINDLKLIRGSHRKQQIEIAKVVGQARAKSWGGKPDPKKDRRSTKQSLKNEL
jgi:hypothetical protein